MRTNFTECGIHYLDNRELSWVYGYNGSTRGIHHNFSSQVTYQGCKDLCGSGVDYYSWSTASATITTWLLPIVGMLLQAPFESNAFWRTMLAICRWVGSPMASLSYILWNIKVSGKCALMVDMAVPYEDQVPGRGSDFASIRDSFYILTTMNQFTMNPQASMRKESEGLLRIALFSKDLRLHGTPSSLKETRQKLAQELREGRKRGVVPVFISTMWFLFALGLSIQSAFGFLGNNSTAHDLALGFLLAWLPVLILGSIVDRNPVAAEDTRRRLNFLVDLVRRSLQDETIKLGYIRSFRSQHEANRMAEWVEKVYSKCEFMENFFVDFAGQGRTPYHYGAAHPILSDIEDCYIADRGRNWLDDEEEARANLVLGPVDGLIWFDFRELWQILSSVIIVTWTVAGAFILSYFTPTVGLGCRSGGYLIFFCISLGLLLLELLVWWASSPVNVEQPQWLVRSRTHLESSASFVRLERGSLGILRRTSEAISDFRDMVENFLIRATVKCISIFLPSNRKHKLQHVEHRMKVFSLTIREYNLKEWTRRFFFIPVEFINTTWLIYIVLAQTFGGYRNCECITSRWASGGGYVDFTQNDNTNSPWVNYYWTSGTVLGSTTMGIGMIYIVVEWCLQSHLSTEDYAAARRGLDRTRRYRLITYPIRLALRFLISRMLTLFAFTARKLNLSYKSHKSLLWTRKTTYRHIRPTRTIPHNPAYTNTPTSPRPSYFSDSSPFLGLSIPAHHSGPHGHGHELQSYPYPSPHSYALSPSPLTGPSTPPSTSIRARENSDASQRPLICTPDPAPQWTIPRKPSKQQLGLGSGSGSGSGMGMGLGLGISTPVGASPRLSSESAVSPTERGRGSEEAEVPLVRSVSWAEEEGGRGR